MRFLNALLALAACTAAHAQTPGTQLTVDVTIDSVALRGDTIGVSYVLYNRPQSQDSMATFTVDAPAGVLALPTPQPIAKWWVSDRYRGQSVAHWVRLGGLPPSATSIPLYVESIALPGIVTYWIVGRFDVPEGEGDDSTLRNPLTDNSVTGKTLGVESFPANRSVQGLLSRLRDLTNASCASPLLWITDSTICAQLINDVDQAEAFRSGGQTLLAKSALTHYETLLSAGSITGSVTNPGYWLLKPNAEIIRNAL